MIIGVILRVNDKLIIQERDYIEDGAFIEIIGSEIKVFEIPFGGGEVIEIGNFKTLLDAFNAVESLT